MTNVVNKGNISLTSISCVQKKKKIDLTIQNYMMLIEPTLS